MRLVSLHAHFDGQHIRLDEPFELLPNTALIVTVLSRDDSGEGDAWNSISGEGLARAYGDDEPEYLAGDVK